MHEISVCQSILKNIESELDQKDLANVREIHLKIGLLSYIEPELLKHVFTFVREGTPFEQSTLVIDMTDILASCEQCGQTFKVEKYKFVCPVCEVPVSEILEGKEFKIHKIILEESAYEEVNK